MGSISWHKVFEWNITWFNRDIYMGITDWLTLHKNSGGEKAFHCVSLSLKTTKTAIKRGKHQFSSNSVISILDCLLLTTTTKKTVNNLYYLKCGITFRLKELNHFFNAAHSMKAQFVGSALMIKQLWASVSEMTSINKLHQPHASAGPLPNDPMCQRAVWLSGLHTQDPSSLLLES